MADESRQELAEPVKELRPPRDEGGGADLEELAAETLEEEAEDFEERGAALLRDRRRVAGLTAAHAPRQVVIYELLPEILGLIDAVGWGSGTRWYWVGVASRF